MNTCRLCLQERELRVSHIIPKWLVKHCRDGEDYKNKFKYLSSKEIKFPPQDGPKEKLMCHDCEQKIGRFEKYFRNFFIGRKDIEIHIVDNGLIEIKNYRYKEIRLFILSILWRLSVSSDKNFSVNLDAHNQEILRKMLLGENPGLPSEFPFYTILVRIDGKIDSKIIMNPIELEHPQNSVALYISGILFFISKTQLNSVFNSFFPPDTMSEKRWLGSIKKLFDIPILYEKYKSTLGEEGHDNS
ncbi:MAG: hypothetical protein SD837_07275 [Candidatus Electrothrix scaldis]|nr:MAG: hypothetical protein SD837_07275 [Candidatus Electrothrix sp. GW3-3]